MPNGVWPVLYSGSVKDVHGFEGKDPYIFSFSDRYSIFDWGSMPDLLEGKGEALAVMGDLFFRHLGDAENWISWKISENYPKFWRDSLMSSEVWSGLRRNGLSHHSLGLVRDFGSNGGVEKSKLLSVRALDRPPIHSKIVDGTIVWDYSAYQNKPVNALVPLEVVFRFGAPEGSSILERMENIPGYWQSLGFSEKPEPGAPFPFPILEFFTKLEPTDRYLTREEARQVAALDQAEFDALCSLSLLLALRLRDYFFPIGLELWDGKFEFAFASSSSTPGGERSFLLVDSIGPDELRLLSAEGVHFSKEFLRQIYRGSPWYAAVLEAKNLAKKRGVKDWKKICVDELKVLPEPLPAEEKNLACLLYPVLLNALLQNFGRKKLYPELPSLADLCRQIAEIR